MKNKVIRRIHLSAKVLLTMLMSFSAIMYIVVGDPLVFTNLGYPAYLMYPLAVAKTLGVIAIWSKKSAILTNWAYAGFFYNVVLALAAHLSVGDGEWMPALMGIILVLVAFYTDVKLKSKAAHNIE